VPSEHDDDLTSSVDTRNDVQTDDSPKTNDEALQQEERQDQERTGRGDRDDESVVGK